MAPDQQDPQTPDQPADEQSQPDLQAQLDDLKRQLEDKDTERQQAVQDALAQAQGRSRGPSSTKTVVDLSGMELGERRKRYADWPVQGGSDDPQPWNLRALGLQGEVVDFDQNNKPGARNTVAPIVIHHGRPMLASGSADPSVFELGRLLGDLGFPNSVSEGQNAFGAVDQSIMAAVYAFRDAYGVEEDPSGFGGDTPQGRTDAAAHIGPWTWEAILRAGKRAEQEQAA